MSNQEPNVEEIMAGDTSVGAIRRARVRRDYMPINDTAQARKDERQAVALWLTGKAKAMRAINRDGSRQLDIAAIELLDGRYTEAIRNGTQDKDA